jgi:hypothetical protein
MSAQIVKFQQLHSLSKQFHVSRCLSLVLHIINDIKCEFRAADRAFDLTRISHCTDTVDAVLELDLCCRMQTVTAKFFHICQCHVAKQQTATLDCTRLGASEQTQDFRSIIVTRCKNTLVIFLRQQRAQLALEAAARNHRHIAQCIAYNRRVYCADCRKCRRTADVHAC